MPQWSGAFCCRTGKEASSSKALAVTRTGMLLGVGAPLWAYSFPPSLPPSDVFPGQMEGVKLVVNKVLSSHFQVLPLLRPLLTAPLPGPPPPSSAPCPARLREEGGGAGP